MVSPFEVKGAYKSKNYSDSFELCIDTGLKYHPASDSVNTAFYFDNMDTEEFQILSKYADIGYTITAEPRCRPNGKPGIFVVISYKFQDIV